MKMNKLQRQADFFATFDNVVYIILCIMTLGLAYLVRLLITYGVRRAIVDARYLREIEEEDKKKNPDRYEPTK